MRLTVNGVSVRVTDRIEVEIDVPKEGDTLLNGVIVNIRGGPLTIRLGSSGKCSAIYVWHDSALTVTNDDDRDLAGYSIQSPRD